MSRTPVGLAAGLGLILGLGAASQALEPHPVFDQARRGSGSSGGGTVSVAALNIKGNSIGRSSAQMAAQARGQQKGLKTSAVPAATVKGGKAPAGGGDSSERPPFFDENSGLAFGAGAAMGAAIGIGAAILLANPLAGLGIAIGTGVLLGLLFNFLK